MKKTKIVCTIGPASKNKSTIKELISAGMNCARINTAYGDILQYETIIKTIRKVSRDFPIMLDIKGPEIRVRLDKDLPIKHSRIFEIGFNKNDSQHFSCDFYGEVSAGQKVFFDNGAIETEIVSKKGGKLQLRSHINSVIKPNKGVNIPNTEIDIPPLTKKDKEVIEFALKNDVAFIALSFTRSAKDVNDLRKKLNGKDIAIIAKIENHQGIKNFDEIMEASEGIMIARGDLGVEIPSEKIPIIQKELINKCNQEGKIVITATQMLESMIMNPMPTRAETSDVANAILDKSDAVMLSGETAVGKFPVRAVETITKISREVEPLIKSDIKMNTTGLISGEIAKAVYIISTHANADKIVCLTRTGFTARMVSRFRMNREIIAVTPNPKVRQHLELAYGVNPVVGKEYETKAIIKNTRMIYKKGLVAKKDLVVFTSGVLSSFMKVSNRIEAHKIEDILNYLQKSRE